jgi:peptidoglycan L-alanyl-D-glutamate endopeptidase CwlK
MGVLRQEVRLRGVHPQLVLMARAWSVQLSFDILITDGVRTNARQAELYAQGRTTPGPIVTNAPTAALSAHGRKWFAGRAFGCAIDAVPCTGPRGAPTYLDTAAYEAMAIIAERMMLMWGGRWTRAADGMDPDKPHFQWPTWRVYPAAPDEVPEPPDFSDVEGGSSTV